MAIRNDIEVNYELSPRIASITTASTELTVQDAHDTLTALQDEPEGHQYEFLISTTGGEPLGGGNTVGLTTVLNDVQIAFQPTSPISNGSVTTGGSTTNLIDSGATFQTDGVKRGDWVINFTDQSVTEVISVVSETELLCNPLRDGTANTFTSADVYKVWEVSEVDLTGGNFTAVDDLGGDISPFFPVFGRFGVKTASSSATLQEQVDIQYASFSGGVWVDANSAFEGTAFPVGTQRSPVNNLSDALSIANTRGFNKLYIQSSMTIDNGLDYDDKEIVGASQTKTALVIDPAASTNGLEISNATVTGTLDGNTVLNNCIINNLSYVNGVVVECALQGTTTLGGATQASFIACYSNVAGTATPTIDCGGDGPPFIMRDYSGGIKLTNKTGSAAASIDMESGQVIIDPTVTAGAITVRGVGKLVNNAGGTATITEEILNPINLNKAVFINGCVYLDTSSGVSGTDFPKGSVGKPVDNVNDALAIAAAQGLKSLCIAGTVTFSAGHDITGLSLIGDRTGNTATIVLNSPTMGTTRFSGAEVYGTATGAATYTNCRLGDLFANGLSGVQGSISKCSVQNAAGISVSGTLGITDTYFFNLASNAVPIEANGNFVGLIGCSGKAELRGFTAPLTAQLDLNGLDLTIASSCTAGTLNVLGVGKVTDNSAGTTVITDDLVSLDNIGREAFKANLKSS